jgi:hypothetical protein
LAGSAEEQIQNHFDSQVSFCNWLRNSKSFFSGGIFQVSSFGQYFFQQAGFQVLGVFIWRCFFVGIVSSWVCRVSEIGFKVFSLYFGWQWF